MHNFTSTITVYDIVCAHAHLFSNKKISDQANNDATLTHSIRKSIVIGTVPDRGGRPGDRSKLPKFKPRVAAAASSHGGGGGGKRSGAAASGGGGGAKKDKRGGRVQGGWGNKPKASGDGGGGSGGSGSGSGDSQERKRRRR